MSGNAMLEGDQKIALYIDPPSYHFLNDRLFDLEVGRFNGIELLAPYVHLRTHFAAKGIPVRTADYLFKEQPRHGWRNVYVSTGMLRDYASLAQRKDIILSGFFAFECPVVEPTLYRALASVQHHVRRIFSWSDGPSLEPFVGGPLRCQPFCWPQGVEQVVDPIWRRSDRKFLVIMNANKLPCLYWQELYTERLNVMEYFGALGEVDLYGRGWDGPPFQLGKSRLPRTVRRAHRWLLKQWQRLRPDPRLEVARRVLRGVAHSKLDTLGQYTFSICFENMVLKGWITEKIFDCLLAGTIPIYWGAPDIETYVAKDCFIDMRNFDSYPELRDFLRSLGPADIQRYKEAARDYYQSPQFRPFSKDAFLDHFRRMIVEDTGVAV